MGFAPVDVHACLNTKSTLGRKSVEVSIGIRVGKKVCPQASSGRGYVVTNTSFCIRRMLGAVPTRMHSKCHQLKIQHTCTLKLYNQILAGMERQKYRSQRHDKAFESSEGDKRHNGMHLESIHHPEYLWLSLESEELSDLVTRDD